MTPEYIIQAYGPWVGMVLIFLYFKLWPLLADKVVPAHLRSKQSQQASREAELLADKQFRQEIERGQMEAQKTIAIAVQDLAKGMVSTNERIATVLVNQGLILSRQEATFAVLTDALGEIRLYNENYGRRTTDKHKAKEVVDEAKTAG